MWLTIPQAATRVNRSTDTIYRWIRLERLRAYEHSDGTKVMESRLLAVDKATKRGRPRIAETSK